MATVAASEAAEAVAAEQALDSTSRRLRWMNWGATGTHCGSKWLKPAKNKFTYSGITSFFIQVSVDVRFRSLHVLHIEKLLNYCKNKYKQSIFRIFSI